VPYLEHLEFVPKISYPNTIKVVPKNQKVVSYFKASVRDALTRSKISQTVYGLFYFKAQQNMARRQPFMLMTRADLVVG
jgi:hypothetical protein